MLIQVRTADNVVGSGPGFDRLLSQGHQANQQEAVSLTTPRDNNGALERQMTMTEFTVKKRLNSIFTRRILENPLVLGAWSKSLRLGKPWPMGSQKWFTTPGARDGVSERLFDPYSEVHTVTGIFLYFVTFGWLHFYISNKKIASGFFYFSLYLSVFLGIVFEYVENSKNAIEAYREVSGTSEGYGGDTLTNIIGDIFCLYFGFMVAHSFLTQGRWYLLLELVIFLEIFTFQYMTDNWVITSATVVSGLMGIELPLQLRELQEKHTNKYKKMFETIVQPKFLTPNWVQNLNLPSWISTAKDIFAILSVFAFVILVYIYGK